MYGSGVGDLAFELGRPDASGEVAWETIWSRSGDSGTPEWALVEIYLNDFSVTHVRFRVRFDSIRWQCGSYCLQLARVCCMLSLSI